MAGKQEGAVTRKAGMEKRRTSVQEETLEKVGKEHTDFLTQQFLEFRKEMAQSMKNFVQQVHTDLEKLNQLLAEQMHRDMENSNKLLTEQFRKLGEKVNNLETKVHKLGKKLLRR